MRAFVDPRPSPFPIRFQLGPLSFEPRQKKVGKENRGPQAPGGFPPAKTFRWADPDLVRLRVMAAEPRRRCLGQTREGLQPRARVPAARFPLPSAIALPRKTARKTTGIGCPTGTGDPHERRCLCLTRELSTPHRSRLSRVPFRVGFSALHRLATGPGRIPEPVG